jgi:CubicO group peptidase (beta-lactamase class C family)
MVAPRVRPSRRRRGAGLAAALLTGALVLGACGVGRGDDGADGPSGDPDIDQTAEARQELFVGVTFDRIAERLREQADTRGLTSASLVLGTTQGSADPTDSLGAGTLDIAAPVQLGESSFWFTAAVLLTLVDDGTLSLDAPIGTTLTDLPAPLGAITLRQLLSHTSGLPSGVTCAEPTVAACDAAIAASAPVDPPGEAFHVDDLDAHVAARLAEVATGQPWAQLFAERIAAPTGMRSTSFADPSTTGGLLAVDGSTTVLDLGRFLSVLRDDGRAGDVTVLSTGSIDEMLRDQTVRLDTHDEPWVAETGVPTYGLGVWRDRLRGDDVASVVSAPNRYGLYPFLDAGRDAWGIVVIDDRTSPRAEVVSQSAVIAQLTAAALRSSPD